MKRFRMLRDLVYRWCGLYAPETCVYCGVSTSLALPYEVNKHGWPCCGSSNVYSLIGCIYRGSKEKAGRIGHCGETYCFEGFKYITPNQKAPNVSAEWMLDKWNSQQNQCLACGGAFDGLQAQFHHNHTTGVPLGFIRRCCNLAEGIIKKFD